MHKNGKFANMNAPNPPKQEISPRRCQFEEIRGGGDNLAIRRIGGRRQCQIRRQSPVPHKTIPAKAGISFYNKPTALFLAMLPPSQTIPAKAGISKGNALPHCMWQHNTVRFLPSQEWSTVERESIGEYGIIAARRQIVAANNRQNTHTPVHPQTIPA